MGTCCLPICETEHLSTSIDRKEIQSEAFNPQSLPLPNRTHSVFFQNSESPESSVKKQAILNFESNENTKPEFSGRNQTLPTQSNLKSCPCGSAYIWDQDLVNTNYTKTGEWIIPCDFCKKLFASSGWLCSGCGSVICRNCSETIGIIPPELRCAQLHFFEYFQDTVVYQVEKFNRKDFECSKCKRVKMEPSWYCRLCNCHLCIDCGRNEGINMKNPIFCYGQHSLQYREMGKKAALELQCSLCFKNGCKSRVFCDECEFNVCFFCVMQTCSKKSLHPGLVCKNQHGLVLDTLKKFKTDEKKWIICSKCNLVNMKYVYGCKTCQICLCMDCWRDFKRIIGEFISKLCANGHPYVWNPKGVVTQETCTFCQVKLEFASFHCLSCKKSVCVECIQYSNSISGRNSSISQSIIKTN